MAGVAAAAPMGGLGVAPLVGVAGLVAAPVALARARRLGVSPAAWAGLVFLAWASLSYLWSPFERPDFALRLAFATPLYVAVFVLALSLSQPRREKVRAAMVFACAVCGALFLMEAATGGAVTRAHRAPDTPELEIWRNLGHGVSVLVVLAPVAVVSAALRGTGARLCVLVAVLGAVCGAFSFGLSANVLGLIGAGAGMLVAVVHPRLGVWVCGLVAAAMVLAAPLIGPLTAVVPFNLRTSMDISWELRLEAWRYVSSRILEKFLFGHGLDSARTISDQVVMRDITYAVVPLHPHNAGLHIWLETGLVGAVLASAVIGLATRQVARAPGLSRAQAAALCGVIGAYAAISFVSYGVWQEWWIATGFLALAGVAALDPRAPRPSA